MSSEFFGGGFLRKKISAEAGVSFCALSKNRWIDG